MLLLLLLPLLLALTADRSATAGVVAAEDAVALVADAAGTDEVNAVEEAGFDNDDSDDDDDAAAFPADDDVVLATIFVDEALRPEAAARAAATPDSGFVEEDCNDVREADFAGENADEGDAAADVAAADVAAAAAATALTGDWLAEVEVDEAGEGPSTVLHGEGEDDADVMADVDVGLRGDDAADDAALLLPLPLP